MCTMITERAQMEGSGRGPGGWFKVNGVNVTFDHPFHLDLDHALNIDFVNEELGPGARVAVELTPAAARELIRAIQTALDRAEAESYT